MDYVAKHAVLLIIFNRPECAKRVFKEIRSARPSRLYVAADGPRKDSLLDAELCQTSRAIIDAVDWPCDVRTLFRTENLGSAQAIPQSVDWFFENESSGIVLEDDCLPCQDFFRFCDELLEKYRFDERVWWINGSTCSPLPFDIAESYAFSKYPISWGWASWKRVWSLFDRSSKYWGGINQDGFISSKVAYSIMTTWFWRATFRYAYSIPNWDYRFVLNCWVNDGLACVPRSNLISNIGFNENATHDFKESDSRSAVSCGQLTLDLVAPSVVASNCIVDRYIEKAVYDIRLWTILRPYIASKMPWLRRLKRWLRRKRKRS